MKFGNTLHQEIIQFIFGLKECLTNSITLRILPFLVGPFINPEYKGLPKLRNYIPNRE